MTQMKEITDGTVLIAIEDMSSPVFTAQMVARQMGWGSISSRDYPYRAILRVLHHLYENNRVGRLYLPTSQNVTVWWDWKRVIDKDIPF